MPDGPRHVHGDRIDRRETLRTRRAARAEGPVARRAAARARSRGGHGDCARALPTRAPRRRRISRPPGGVAGSRPRSATQSASRSAGTSDATRRRRGCREPFASFAGRRARTRRTAPRRRAPRRGWLRRRTSRRRASAPNPPPAPAPCTPRSRRSAGRLRSRRSRADSSVATPKSRRTTRPPRVTSTLDGLMSRCSLPAAWSACTPPRADAARSAGPPRRGRRRAARARRRRRRPRAPS